MSAATRQAKGPADKAGLEQAIALDARFAVAHSELGWCLFGMVTENLLLPGEAGPLMRASAQRAIQADPLNLIMLTTRGMLLVSTNRSEEAELALTVRL